MYHGYFLDQHARHVRREYKGHETIGYVEHVQKEKNTNIEMTEFEERYQEIVDTIKKPPPKKKYMTRNNVKDQVERENTAAAEAEDSHTEAEAQGIAAAEVESTFAEAVAQEIERRSMMRSSTVTDQRCVPGQHEHRRQDGWTSTPRWSDDEKKGQ